MALPAIDAERWRLVEQKLAEYGTDIARLWRQLQNVQTGGYGNSGALTPTDLAALSASGSGGESTDVPVWHITVRAAAASGTINWSAADVVGGTVLSSDTGTFAFDDGPDEVAAALATFDPDVVCIGGSLLWNSVKIKFSEPTMRIHITGHDLVREAYSPEPNVNCCFARERLIYWD